MQLKNILKISIMGAVLSLSAQASANLVKNGSFEDLSDLKWGKGTYNGSVALKKPILTTGAGNIANWETSGHPIEVWGPKSHGRFGGPSAADDGLHFVELNSRNGGFYLYQDINTQVGQSYDFSFAYHARTNRTESFTAWILDDNGNTVNNWVFSDYTKNQWNQFDGSFVATSSASKVLFTSENSYDPLHQPKNKGNFLDDIRVTATAVSEPATFALLGLGLLGAGITRKRAKA